MKYVRGRIFAPETIYGKSAYEIAILHGYEGTEEEWLASLTEAANEIAMESAESASESASKAKESEENAKASENRAAELENSARTAATLSSAHANDAMSYKEAVEAAKAIVIENANSVDISQQNAKESEIKAKESETSARKSAEEAEKAATEAKENAEKLSGMYSDLNLTLDAVIAIQEALINGGADIPVISGVYRFNEKARKELGVNATLSLEKTNVKFTASNSDVQFTAIYSSEYEAAYWDSDGRIHYVHESGMFDNGGYGDILDFGASWQVVTAEFLAWVDYYMERVG